MVFLRLFFQFIIFVKNIQTKEQLLQKKFFKHVLLFPKKRTQEYFAQIWFIHSNFKRLLQNQFSGESFPSFSASFSAFSPLFDTFVEKGLKENVSGQLKNKGQRNKSCFEKTNFLLQRKRDSIRVFFLCPKKICFS